MPTRAVPTQIVGYLKNRFTKSDDFHHSIILSHITRLRASSNFTINFLRS